MTTEAIKTRDLESIVSASGKIQPKRLVNISADTPGRVVNLAVNEGDRVKVGQFLLQIDPRNLRTVRQINRAGINFSVARVPNTSRLLLASSEQKVFEIDAGQDNPTAAERADHGRYVNCVRLRGNVVVSGGYDNRLIWWDLANNRVIRTTDAHTRQVRQLAVSPDGTKLASVGDDMVCRLWDMQTGQRLLELRGHRAQPDDGCS